MVLETARRMLGLLLGRRMSLGAPMAVSAIVNLTAREGHRRDRSGKAALVAAAAQRSDAAVRCGGPAKSRQNESILHVYQFLF